jgi:hypothetical protein
MSSMLSTLRFWQTSAWIRRSSQSMLSTTTVR